MNGDDHQVRREQAVRNSCSGADTERTPPVGSAPMPQSQPPASTPVAMPSTLTTNDAKRSADQADRSQQSPVQPVPCGDTSALSGNPTDVRREHLAHEASVRGISVLHYALGGYVVAIASGVLIFQLAEGARPFEPVMRCSILASIGFLLLILGHGIRGLKPWSRKPAIILAGIAALVFPVGTLFGVYALHLLVSVKGKVVYSPAYRDVIAQTPGLQYATPWSLRIALVVVLAAFVTVVSIAIVHPHWPPPPSRPRATGTFRPFSAQAALEGRRNRPGMLNCETRVPFLQSRPAGGRPRVRFQTPSGPRACPAKSQRPGTLSGMLYVVATVLEPANSVRRAANSKRGAP